MRIEQRPIAVEHVEIHSARSFDDVARRLETALPQFNPAILDALASGDQEGAERLIGHATLFIFLKRHHGEILEGRGSTAQGHAI